MAHKRPSSKQYYESVSSILSELQLRILRALYYMPDSRADSITLAKALGYKAHQGANLQIGKIGRAIYQYTGIEPPVYEDRGTRFAYFYFVGDWVEGGWMMWPELKDALEKLGEVSKSSSIEISSVQLIILGGFELL